MRVEGEVGVGAVEEAEVGEGVDQEAEVRGWVGVPEAGEGGGGRVDPDRVGECLGVASVVLFWAG